MVSMRRLVVVSVLVVCAVAHRAEAQLDEPTAAARRALITDAQQASDHGDHRHALDLALRAGQLRMSATLRRFIAEEQNELGRFVEALNSARLCIEEAGREPTVRDREDHLA